MTGISYGSRLAELAAADPGGTALVVSRLDGSEAELSWEELDRWSNQVARLLAAEGLGQGDRLALELPNGFELVVGAFAGWKLGATVVPVRWDLPAWELSRVHGVLEATVVVDRAGLGRLDDARRLSDEPLPDVVAPVARGLCSSGSTGTPKVVLIERPALIDERPLSMTYAMIESYGPLPHPERILVPGPMYHTNSLAGLSHMLLGDSIIVFEKFDPVRALELIETRRVQGFTAATIFLQRMARVADVDRRDLSSLLWVQQGAAFLPHWLARRWIELLGPERFYMSYGMTEGLGLCMIRGDEWLAHPGSVGRPFGGTTVSIRSPDGEELPPSEVGEIYLRTPGTVAFRYVGEVPPLPSLPDGSTTVGDLGWLDEEGYLYIADRRTDMIITGGANVFPAEVEAALSEHPGIADVAVIGLADPEWGRRVHAVVVRGEAERPGAPPPLSSEEVVAFAKSRLAPYKVPKSVEFVPELPRSAATKLNRAALVAEREGGAPPAASAGDPAGGQGGQVAPVHVQD